MMKRPLDIHFDRNVRNGLQKGKWMLSILFLFLAFTVSHGQTFSRTECDCLDNATTDSNGQYGEQVTINSAAGETWTITSVEGLFQPQPFSPAPPFAPTPLTSGLVIDEGLPGNYILNAIRVAGTSWEMVVSNGAVSIPINSSHVCEQPSNTVLGDFGTCIGSIETYELDIPASLVANVNWSLSGGGNIVGGQGTNRIFVDWGDVVGSYDVSFTGEAYSYDGQFANPCAIAGSGSVTVMDEEAFSMACNNQVNISLNGQCELNFAADMILEDMQFSNDSYDLEFTDTETGEPVVGPTLGMEYVGKTLEVKVIHECSGNSCWGYVLLEDKSIPPLECGDDVTIDCDEVMAPSNTGLPIGDDVIATYLGDDKYSLIGFDLCSEVILSYEDVPVNTDLCDGPFSSIVNRTWVAVDQSGNSTSCIESIFVNNATLDDITFPENFDDVLGPNPSLQACGNYPTLPNGNPDPSFTGMPQGVFCLNVKVDFEDTRLAKCGDEAYKIRRKWTISDHCATGPGAQVTHTQNITVMDNEAPVCVAPNEFTVGASELSCSSIIEVPPPIVTFECSDWDYTVSYKLADENGDPFFQPTNDGVVRQGDGTYLISGLDDLNGDMVWIVYYLTDACGNLSTCFTEATIIDEVQPIPVCDLHTFVGLNADGEGYAGVESFDDGSWDNCGIDKLEVRRVDNFACGENTQWAQKVKFCCEDVGEIIMVQLRVTDKSGNSNVCMVEAEVQDNHAPEITFCPADITIDCDDDTVNLDQYGTATAIDNCTVKITSTVNRNINSCGTGTITRTFRAEDDNGNFVTCQQRISVNALDPFYVNPNNPDDPNDDIIWPGSHTILNGCASNGVHPDELPAGKQRPVIVDEGCSQISFTYDDVLFQYTDEACVKILRTWKVIDDCVYTPFSNVGVWTYTQVIKVENSTAPDFIIGCSASDFTITQQSNCTARIQATATAIDDCTPESDLIFSYRVDEDNDGSTDFTGSGATINRQVSFGNHRIIWEVEDECGNIRTCAAILNVDDNKPPTPYCHTEIVTVVMETSGSVSIWASDFDKGAFDNCADNDELRFSFTTNPNDNNRTYTCDDLEGESTSVELNIYVTDPAGNQEFCIVNLVIQDNQNHCENNVNGGGNNNEERMALGGQILNDVNQNVSGVEVSLNADLPEFPHTVMTTGSGTYAFENLPINENYTITPSMDENYNEGVSTLDLVLIQQHLLGLKLLDNPYKVIAADINNSERVTASDLLQLRKLILGIYSELPSNESWRFVDAALEFDDVNDPFPYQDEVGMNQMTEDYMDADFVAIKIGDVNSSANPTLNSEENIETRSVLTFSVEDSYLEIGKHTVSIKSSDAIEVYGLQFALDINEAMVNDIALSSETLEIGSDNYIREDNKLKASIHSAASQEIEEELLYLVIDVKKAGYLSEMLSISSSTMMNEVYTEGNGNIKSAKFSLEMEGRSTDGDHSFELLQNVPNPFSITTEIGFVLPSEQEVTLRVLDVTGKMLMSRTNTFKKGYNTILLDVSDIDASGILYYQLDTEGNSATKKMIIIK